jgi:predicted MFS family arabinose efflux permease
VGLGSIVGPATGGIVVGTAGWRVLFAITAAAMLAITLKAQRKLPRRNESPRRDQPPFDFVGALLLSSFLVALLLTLTLGPNMGWLAPITLAGALASMLLVFAFVMLERQSHSPMLDLNLFRNPDFALGALGAFVVFMGISAIRFLVPFFLQGVRGYAAATVGLLIVPAALVTATIAPFAGRLADRWGVRLFANVGLAITTLGFAVFIGLHVMTPVWVIVAGLMVTSFGMATFGAARRDGRLRESVSQLRQRDRRDVRNGRRHVDDGRGRLPGIAGSDRSDGRSRRVHGLRRGLRSRDDGAHCHRFRSTRDRGRLVVARARACCRDHSSLRKRRATSRSHTRPLGVRSGR